MIRFEHVTRHYGDADAPALSDISVEFGRGDFVFLIGASGSGKSTLLRMILREGLPQQGKVTVAGQNLSLMLPKRVPEYRRSIGMVFQDFRLLPDKTVYENVAFAMQVIGAPRQAIRKRVMKVLSRVKLDHLAKRYPHEISGGEQQRAAIARAIVNSPAILLADEPTGNLDPRASAEVMKILRWINSSGTTVIMATHDRAIVDRMRRRVVQLHNGRLVRDEPGGLYDPPEGSQAWEILSAEEAKTGLRASDPMPVRTELNPVVPAMVSARELDEAGESETEPQMEEQGHQGQAGEPEKAGGHAEPSRAAAAASSGAGAAAAGLDERQRLKVNTYRVTWPEDEDTSETEQSASAVDAADIPSFEDEPDTDALTSLPPQATEENQAPEAQEPEIPAPQTPAGEAPEPKAPTPKAQAPKAQAPVPRAPESQPHGSSAREAQTSQSPAGETQARPRPQQPTSSSRLSWLSQAAEDSAAPQRAGHPDSAHQSPGQRRGPGEGRDRSQERATSPVPAADRPEASAQKPQAAPAEPTETQAEPPRPVPRLVPRPRASAAEATYTDSQRTAEQLSSSKGGLFRRKRRRRT